MKRNVTTIMLALAMLMGVHSAKAWGLVGHHIVAYIAEKHLTPETKAKCEHYLNHKVTHYSLWMDYWRNTDPFKRSTNWHMNNVDEDFNTVGFKGKLDLDAVTQIERIVGEMSKGKYRNMSDSLVAVNLKFLIHMVGDMHCPCHVGYPKSMGLKIAPLLNKGKKINHHSFWDSAPNHMHPKWNADNFLKACDTYSPKEIKKIQKGNATKWGKQNAAKMMDTYTYWDEGTELKKLSPEQRKKIDKTMFEQMAYAGYRLAGILNNLMSK